jgi:hypothetical protein
VALSGIGFALATVKLDLRGDNGVEPQRRSCVLEHPGNLVLGRGHGHGEFSDLFWDSGDARWALGSYRGQPALFRVDATQEEFLVTTWATAKYAYRAVIAGVVALIRSIPTPPDGVE